MKKIFIASLMMFFAFIAYSQNGIIREFTGDVTIKAAGNQEFVPAAVGSTVAQNAIVSTGFRSTAVITIGTNTITVRPLTRLTLAEIQSSANSEEINVNLQAGRVRVDVNPPAGTRSEFKVQGPSATASVRGTSFEIDARNLQVIEGKVIYTGNNGFISVVSAGTSGAITDGGSAQDPVEIVVSELFPSAPIGAGASGESIIPNSPVITSSHGYIEAIPRW